MSTKKERSNRDIEPSRQKQNTSGQNSTRSPAHSKAARERDSTSDIPRKHENHRSH